MCCQVRTFFHIFKPLALNTDVKLDASYARASWYITSVFLLIVSSKLAQASEKVSVICCICCVLSADVKLIYKKVIPDKSILI